jgi:hypothetical protein
VIVAGAGGGPFPADTALIRTALTPDGTRSAAGLIAAGELEAVVGVPVQPASAISIVQPTMTGSSVTLFSGSTVL